MSGCPIAGGFMKKRHECTDQQFADAIRHLVLNKPGESPTSEDHELTLEELEQSFGLDSQHSS